MSRGALGCAALGVALALGLSAGAQDAAPPAHPSERVMLPREGRPLLGMELTRAGNDAAAPLLVLFHEARSSRGEYRPIVPRLVAAGRPCLAVDLSSGGVCREVKNMTARNAFETGGLPNYLDALPDVIDALRWAREHHPEGPVVAWGSGYSASLALHVAAQHPELADGVIAFSPGEYFTTLGKDAHWIRDSVRGLERPLLVCAARGEEEDWMPIFEVCKGPRSSFVPEAENGAHGSRALWPEQRGGAGYWTAVERFLDAHFPVGAAPAETKTAEPR